jgi:mannose-6-phosphate isomerase
MIYSPLACDGRPWGMYYVLVDGATIKVKRIVINPGQSPSYQYHHKRNEHWFITEGEGIAILDDKEVPVQVGNVIWVPKQMKHRLKNTGNIPLEFIEVQTGEYFGEDDIVRISDDYGRTT